MTRKTTANIAPLWINKFVNKRKSKTKKTIRLCILEEVSKYNEMSSFAEGIGVFVINTQWLEILLKMIVSVPLNYDTIYKNKGHTIICNPNKIYKNNVPLGKLIEHIKAIRILDSETKKNELDVLISNLISFSKKRNDYIHHLIQKINVNNFEEMKNELYEANEEVRLLNEEAYRIYDIIHDVYGLDYTELSHLRHRAGKNNLYHIFNEKDQQELKDMRGTLLNVLQKKLTINNKL
jgi:hypothetical protein